MEWQGVEIELQVPCAKGKKHPVRLRFTGWGEYEVIYNPCVELLGEALARMAPCSHYLQERKWWTGDSSLRKRVVDALSQAGSPAVPALIQALGDNWEGVRSAACGALGAIGDPHAVPALSVWAAAGEQAAQDALQSLGQPPMELQEAITHLLHAGDWGVVQRALGNETVREAVVQLGAQAVPALIQALGDGDRYVRSAACEALGRIGDPHAVPALIQALGDGDRYVRSAACEALGRIGDPHAVPALIQALGDGDRYVRSAACEALGRIGDPHAVPAFIQALGDGDWDVRKAACGALGRIGDPQAVPALSVWAAAGEQAAQDALQSLGQPPMELQEAITHLLHAGDWCVVQRALWHNAVCEAVAQVGAPAVPALIQALGDNWAVVRSAACAALGVIGDLHAVPALIQALGDDWGSVRSAACAALGVIGDPHAVPALEKVAAQDSDGGVRGAARQAIREIQEKNRQ